MHWGGDEPSQNNTKEVQREGTLRGSAEPSRGSAPRAPGAQFPLHLPSQKLEKLKIKFGSIANADSDLQNTQSSLVLFM